MIKAILFAALLSLSSVCADALGPISASAVSQEGQAMGAMPSVPSPSAKGRGPKPVAPPVPNVWLSYGSASSDGGAPISVQLPRGARRIMREHWKTACAYYYLTASRRRSRQERIDLLTRMLSASVWTIQKLTRVKVNAPGGMREITEAEATGIVKLLNTFAKGYFAPGPIV